MYLDPAADVRVLEFEFEFLRPAHFRWFHGSAVHAFVRALLAYPEQFPRTIRPDSVESGRVRYKSGDRYRIGFTVLPSGLEAAASLVGCARRLHELSAKWDAAMPLRDNVRLIEVRDVLSGGSVGDIADAEPIGGPRLDRWIEERSAWSEVCVRFRSPVRIQASRDGRGSYLDESNFDLDRFLSILDLSSRQLIADASGSDPHAEESLDLPAWETVDRRLLWIDAPRVNETKTFKLLGGLAGALDLNAPGGIGREWAERLVLAEIGGVGMSPNFGFGRVEFESPDVEPLPLRTSPASTFFDRAFCRANLEEARTDVVRKGGMAGVDGEDVDDWNDDPRHLDQLESDLREGRYRPNSLLGVMIPKRSGGLRAIGVPTVRDRVASRALVLALRDGVDQLLEDSSFAYRRGLSRRNAAREIDRLRREGYVYVLESDIESFFDTVNWSIVEARIEAILGNEDPCLSLIRGWLRAPVEYQHRRIERDRGLPQGSVISPLLANVLLDRFDERMEQMGFRLVRFADDFVVLCKKPEDVERARAHAEQVLSDLALRLKDEKTLATSFEAGFRYLGYLFTGSIVLESKYPDSPTIESTLESIEDWPWLPEGPAESLEEVEAKRAWQGAAPEPGPLILLPPPARVSSRGGKLFVQRREQIQSIPWSQVSDITAIGVHHFTGHAERDALRRGIPVQLCAQDGVPLGVLSPWTGTPGGTPESTWTLWLEQATAASDPGRRLPFCQRIVSARLHNIWVLLGRFDELRAASERVGVDRLAESALQAQTLDELRGLEGAGTRVLFGSLEPLLDPRFHFAQRNRRPPRDPINAMLSFGYTILHAHAASALQAVGLLPWIGLYHESGRSHAALASDLMEEFRYLVELLVLRLTRKQQVKPEDFRTAKSGAVWMNDDTRRLVVTSFEETLGREVSETREGPATTYRALIRRQAKRIADYVREDQPYEPWLAR